VVHHGVNPRGFYLGSGIRPREGLQSRASGRGGWDHLNILGLTKKIRSATGESLKKRVTGHRGLGGGK